MVERPDEIGRREFVSRAALTAAGVVVAGAALGEAQTGAAPAKAKRVMGANDRVVLASIGVRGQGNALKHGFARSRTSRSRPSATSTRTCPRARQRPEAGRRGHVQAGLRAGPTARPRRQGHRRAWSSPRRTTGTRSPPSGPSRRASTSTSRSRRRTRSGKAGRWSRPPARYNKIVQVGTMNRSRPAVREAIKFIHDGGIGEVFMARGLCYKRAASDRQIPGRADDAGREVRAER